MQEFSKHDSGGGGVHKSPGGVGVVGLATVVVVAFGRVAQAPIAMTRRGTFVLSRDVP